MSKQIIDEHVRCVGHADLKIWCLLVAERERLVVVAVSGDEDGLALRFAIRVGVGRCLAEVADGFRGAA